MILILLLLSLFQRPQPPAHLDIAASSSEATASPGSKVSLFLDITPKPGIHVYAPGAKDYVPIAVVMDPRSGVTFADLHYPKSELMDFAGEKVPVYEKAFRLVEDVSIAPSVKRGTLTLTGTVKYQACDDRVCFIPASVPQRWTIKVK
jgi:DsbC/DsbD-like thiol-disulfide interchange protein